MSLRLFAPALLLLLVIGCGGSKITKANADLIKKGMTDAEVSAILGAPNESQEVAAPDEVAKAISALGGLAGMPGLPALPGLDMKVKESVWKEGGKKVVVHFHNGKVVFTNATGF